MKGWVNAIQVRFLTWAFNFLFKFWLSTPCKVRKRIWMLLNWDPVTTSLLSSSAEHFTFTNNEITSSNLHIHLKMKNWDKLPTTQFSMSVILLEFRILRLLATWTMFAVFIAISNGWKPIVTGFTLKFWIKKLTPSSLFS